MQPSFSGLFVTCAYLPHTTLPDGVTRPDGWKARGRHMTRASAQLRLHSGARRSGTGLGSATTRAHGGVRPRREATGGRFDQLRAPRSEQLTSMTVPFVITPSDVYSGDCGFFFT